MGDHRILFVCSGNTCRSPLAAALANSHLRGITAESAGTLPGYSVAKHTVELAADLVNVDLATHVPRDVRDLELDSFDIVVALDSMTANDLKDVLAPSQRLVCWEVRDRYRGTLDDYRRCAEQIAVRLPELVE